MTRTFLHDFEPVADSPVTGPTVSLTVSEIESAGIREVLQTPGAGYGAWSLLDALLVPGGSGTPFVFSEPLGQAREVKVALSGLFGRFVARAYLERYFGLSVFAHLGRPNLLLDGRRKLKIKRLLRGDLPDWVTCKSDLSSLTVAEAKGCHDVGGPEKALARAWAQVQRVDITARGRKVTVKRIAIATRWGMASEGPSDARLSVRDPDDEGVQLDADDEDALFIGIFRLHVANLLAPLGHRALAEAIRALTRQTLTQRLQQDILSAQSLLDDASPRHFGKLNAQTALVGGIVTRSGPILGAQVSASEEKVLDRLHLRPVFVGVEFDVVSAAIRGDASAIRAHLGQSELKSQQFAWPDRAGGWIVPLGSPAQGRD